MKQFIIFLLCLNTCELISQDLPIRDMFTASGYTLANGKKYDESISGSKYLKDHWNSKAMVYTVEGKSFEISNINFDVLLGAFVTRTSDGKLLGLNDNIVLYVVFENINFKVVDNQYMEVISDQKNEIYKGYFLSLKEGNIDPFSKKKTTDDTYVIDYKYYLKDINGLSTIQLNKRSFYKLIKEEDKEQIEKYIKENSLDIKDENDLKQIFKFYNSI